MVTTGGKWSEKTKWDVEKAEFQLLTTIHHIFIA